MMTNPASASGRVGGRIRLQQSRRVAARLAQHQLAQPVGRDLAGGTSSRTWSRRAHPAPRRRSPVPARRTRGRPRPGRHETASWSPPSSIGPALPSARYQFITSAVAREKATCCLTAENVINFGGKETDLIPVIANGQSWPMTPAVPDLRGSPPLDHGVLNMAGNVLEGTSSLWGMSLANPDFGIRPPHEPLTQEQP